MGVALTSDNCAENPHARHACHITHNVVQMKIHLIQGLLHVLHILDHYLGLIVAMAEETPELTDVLGRTKRGCKQPITM